MLIMPIIVLFYQDNGLGMKEVLLLQGIYSVAIVLLEIPSGYAADIWGRRSTLIFGSILGAAGFLIYSFSFGFWGFLIAELVLGIGQSFISGSDSAMLYDTLLAQNRAKDYLKYEGRVISIGNFSETAAAIIGGLLAEISLRHPFYAQTAVACIGIPAAILLQEPVRHKQMMNTGFRNIINVVKYALFTHKKLCSNIIFSSIIGCATLTMAWFIQPYLDTVLDFSKSAIGATWAVLNLIVGLCTLIAYKVERILKPVRLIVLFVVLISGGYIVSGILGNLWALPVFLVFYATRGIATPVLKDYINRLTGSEMRATVLSLRNFIIRIFFAATGPFLGWFADLYSLKIALILAGSSFFVLGSIAAVFYIIFILRKPEIPEATHQ